MLKATVRIDQHTNVADTIRRLEERAASGDLSPDALHMVLEQSRRLIEDFFERGMRLTEIGSQMNISQTIDGPGYLIAIHARFGSKESLWERIAAFLRGQRCV